MPCPPPTRQYHVVYPRDGQDNTAITSIETTFNNLGVLNVGNYYRSDSTIFGVNFWYVLLSELAAATVVQTNPVVSVQVSSLIKSTN